jgi:23S rRNA (pseudouridine1915-N3)-methyltransferase
MKIRILSVGKRLPGWVNEGFATYVKRLPRENALLLEEIPASRGRGDAARRTREEGDRLLSRVAQGEYVVALDEAGTAWTSRELAGELERWRHLGVDVALLVGGPDGLSDHCTARADKRWSLSRHTLPHGLVRVMVAEQIYRAWTLLHGHPYHRD